MKHLRAAAQGLGEGGRADWQNHELLYIDAVIRMGAAVDDVHHRHRHSRARPQMPVERQPSLRGGRVSRSQGHGQNGVGTQSFLVRGTVQLNEPLVHSRLSRSDHAK